jgi:hypothetical protein
MICIIEDKEKVYMHKIYVYVNKIINQVILYSSENYTWEDLFP